MGEAENTPLVEDLELDSADADAVKGGLTHKQRQAQIAHLEKLGYVGTSCDDTGDIYVNPKTHATKIVPYAH